MVWSPAARARPRVSGDPAAEGVGGAGRQPTREASQNAVNVRFPVERNVRTNTLAEYRDSLIEGLNLYMLGQRMVELTQQAEPPFIQGGSGYRNMAPEYRSFTYGASAWQGRRGPGDQGHRPGE